MEQRQNDGRVASLLEHLDEFGKRLDMSLARRSENEGMIKEMEKEDTERKMRNRQCGCDCKEKSTVGAEPSVFWGAGGARARLSSI